MKKRLFAVFASLCMVGSMVPTMAFAQDSGTTIGVSDLCEHHIEHTVDCGYTEGTAEIPCPHEHTEDCYTLVTKCVHEHTAECYPAESVSENTATPPEPGEAEPTVCTHECSEESGCMTKTLDCKHEHDEACGYVSATEGTPCTFVCEVCNPQDSGNPATPSDAQPEECTCETLCTEGKINADCPVCSADGAELDKVCVGAAPMLPVTALAAAPGGQMIYVGNENVTSGGYWTTDNGGNVTAYTGEGTPADDYIHYDAGSNTLTLHNATIKEGVPYDTSTLIVGTAIGVLNQNGDAELTITLEGTNTIKDVSTAIYVLAPSTGSANLTIMGDGILNAISGSNPGIRVQSNTSNGALAITDAKVTASSSGYSDGVEIRCGDSSNASLTVNGGSLTATGRGTYGSGIRLQFGSGDFGSGTPTVTVSGNAIVRSNGSAGGITGNSSTGIQYKTGSDSTGGIVFNGTEGTVYGDVTLQEDITIGEDESLTLDGGASLNTGDHNLIVDGGTLDKNLANSLGDSVKYAPTIIDHPKNVEVKENEIVTFTVEATGTEPLSYQWQQSIDNGKNWTNIASANAAEYTTGKTTMDMNGWQYRCVVTGYGTAAESNAATLTVNEPVTHTITVHASAGGTAIADKTAAAAGEIVTLTATPDSGYHFDGWSVVSGTVTIQNNQFIMPAENVEIRAVFDRNSSSGGSDSSYTQRQEEFWDEVKEQIRDADPGDTIRVNAGSYDRLPYSVMKLLGEQDDVTLRISWDDGDPIEIPSAFAENEPQRVYYPLEELAEKDFTQPAEPEADKQAAETPADTGGSTGTAGSISGSWTGGTVAQSPESKPEAEGPDSEPESEPETEPESEPTIPEPDEETMTEPERGKLPMSWILGGAVIVIAVGAGGFWFWNRRTRE